ncbi:MAG: hypothetical protein IKX71_01945 [Bacteroidales bacterium]|nr:hypothetical protein [Bacteroidales bacterium]
MKHRPLISLLCVLCLMAAGCSVHEVPEGGDDSAAVALSLNIILDKEMPQHSLVSYSTKASAPEARYIVRFYPRVGDHYLTDTPFEFVKTEADLTDRTYSIGIFPMDYHVEVWADWIQGGTPYYDTANFGAIGVNTNPYSGADIYRDAFCGSFDIDLSAYPGNNSIATAEVTLHRPNARFTFISTDREDFLRHWASEIALNDGTGVKDPDSIDLDTFRVRIIYPQFMPSEYNVGEGEVTNSATGVWFETSMTMLKDGTVEVGWDWVLADGDASSVMVSLEFFDNEGNLINRIGNILVPVAPGKLTTITGRLLTNNISSGITIDPSFDGEFIVHIN